MTLFRITRINGRLGVYGRFARKRYYLREVGA